MLPHESDGEPPAEIKPNRCPEIDCVRHVLPQALIDLAETHAENTGVGADQVLITWGFLSEETYVAALANFLGIAVDPLFNTPRTHCPLPDDRLTEAANTGMLPLLDRSGVKFVVAPRLVDSRRLVEVAISGTDLARRIRITSTARLRDFVSRHSAAGIEQLAVDDLRTRHPELSAGIRRLPRVRTLASAALIVLASTALPSASTIAAEIFLGAIFLAWAGLRLFGLLSERLLRRRPHTFPDDGLPIYSIVVALYREARAVPGLVAALRKFNYPREKLDIKLVLEPDDRETRLALDRLQLGPPFEIHVAPARGPRTKPKALNAALPFVRGEFVAVFDAEDQPEPDQLRAALEAFTAGTERLACVQARLTIDNTVDSWIARGIMAQTPQATARHAPRSLGAVSREPLLDRCSDGSFSSWQSRPLP